MEWVKRFASKGRRGGEARGILRERKNEGRFSRLRVSLRLPVAAVYDRRNHPVTPHGHSFGKHRARHPGLKSPAGTVSACKRPSSDQKTQTALSADGTTGEQQHWMIPCKMAEPFWLASGRTKSDPLPGHVAHNALNFSCCAPMLRASRGQAQFLLCLLWSRISPPPVRRRL